MPVLRVLVTPSLIALLWVVVRALSKVLLGSSSFLLDRVALSCSMRPSCDLGLRALGALALGSVPCNSASCADSSSCCLWMWLTFSSFSLYCLSLFLPMGGPHH